MNDSIYVIGDDYIIDDEPLYFQEVYGRFEKGSKALNGEITRKLAVNKI